MEKLRVGLIGLGARGGWLVGHLLCDIEEIVITAVCDLYEDRVKYAQNTVEERGFDRPFGTTDYKEVLTKEKVDCVLVVTSWKTHVEVALAALEAGIPCGMEVGGAHSLDECFALVEAYERTKTPFMFLENCCYGRREMMVLNMVKLGVFGKISHCEGGYRHDLRDEIARGKEIRHYRLEEYTNRNCENYPTHELGPIALVLDINRGNRMVSLTSTASLSQGLHEYIENKFSDNEDLMSRSFAQGDVVTTVIKCERGETITLTLDTTLPRFYSRGFAVHGTKGMYTENCDSVYLDGDPDEWNWKPHWGNASEYEEKYEHKVWKDYLEAGIKAGHGGMDYLVYSDFFNHVISGEPMPLDVYDAAAWMCITPLSEISIANGSKPVEIPDFKK